MDTTFAASPVLLSRHVAPSKGTAAEGDVLSPAGVQIRPSPSHEFHLNDNLIMSFQLYNAATNVEMAKPLVRVTVTLMKENVAAKPIDYVLSDIDNQPVPHLTFAKYISLEGLPTGTYTARIDTHDMVTHKVVRQDASFIVGQ